MIHRIAIIQGNPSPTANHFGHALADAYSSGAIEGGHDVQRVEIAKLALPFLTTKEEYEHGELPPDLAPVQATIRWADHLVFIFPLLLGTMPSMVKAFLEQVFRPSFAFSAAKPGGWPKKLLQGRSARVIVTMGMPAFWYRWFYLAHGVRGMERNVLRFCGIAPIRETLIGTVETEHAAKREKWLVKMRQLGRTAA